MTLTDSNGGVVLTGEALLIKPDQIFMQNATGSVSLVNPTPIIVVLTKLAA